MEEDPDIEAKRAASLKAAWGASAGENDAGENDAGENDAGENDAGENDAGENDAGENDAGENDAGGDTEPPSVDALSTEELERIIAARKAAESEGQGI